MRRAVSSLIAAAALVGGLALAAPAPVSAQECEGMGCAQSNYERTSRLPAYGSRYDGYWDRRGEHRRRYYGRRYYDDGSWRHGGYHYYPGYGYYADRGDGRRESYGHRERYDGYRDDRGHGGRAEDCARRYRSYDYRSGTYVGYDGYRHYCG